MFSAFLAILFLLSLIVYLKEHEAQQRRAKTRDLPRELLPHHYLCFVIVENRLWVAASENERGKWFSGSIRLQTFEATLAREFVQGLRQDFAQANRIFSIVMNRSSSAKILTQMEAHRIKMSFAYYIFSTLVRLRLLTDRVSLKELRRLTNIVSTMAYEVRMMLDAWEFSGRGDLWTPFPGKS